MMREVCNLDMLVVPHLEVGGHLYQTWQEAVERDVAISIGFPEPTAAVPISFPGSRQVEEIHNGNGKTVGTVVRRQNALTGRLEVVMEAIDDRVSIVTVRAVNLTPMPEDQLNDNAEGLMRTFASAHVILRVECGGFFSMTDPPGGYEKAAADCQNRGVWPVLVGDPTAGDHDTLLASPIILEDYPRIAPQSAGNLYDGLEIDEILSLRIMTMTDAEKHEMRGVDEQARCLLERTDSLGADHLMKMHGTMRPVNPFDVEIFGSNSERIGEVTTHGVRLKAGDAVIVRPNSRADAIDMMIAGKRAIIEALEEDAEGKVHAAVVLDDDPGRDLGILRQPGHRFFYGIDEIEPVANGKEVTA
jgi:hypothetical protein